jgi:predicted Fe-Mo cluster-binding NifX family protein
MKTAISTDGHYVSDHFGRCPSFTIAEIEEGRLVNKEILDNPGHHPGSLPDCLSQNGVTCIIAGGMGRRAEALFAEKGIQTLLGVTGKVDQVIEKLISGTLEGSQSLCKPGSGRGYGIEKRECDHPEHGRNESA